MRDDYPNEAAVSLKKENAELKRANEILKRRRVSSRPSSTGRTHARSVRLRLPGPLRRRRADIQDTHRARLQDRPSTYYAHKKSLETFSARCLRNGELKERIQEVCTSSCRVYGARKIWRELNRQGHAVARCTVERLIREIGTSAVRGRKAVPTIADPAAERALDLLDRDFVATAPNRCWVADFTHFVTWSGVVSVAFVVDTFRHVRPVEYEATAGTRRVYQELGVIRLFGLRVGGWAVRPTPVRR
ncbi:IS3 family transposase [Streptomyces sp. NPDC050263]|uniref:IS3 family transposase n=1 Tax=Streptomyces sp. NPDC050263 TaxID=3155037 RepID=UPI00341A2631